VVEDVERAMTYVLDPELAAVATTLPAVDLHDLPATRAAELQAAIHLPAYESATPLTVVDVYVPGPAGAPDVPVRVYAPLDRDGYLPGLLFLHGGAFVGGSVALGDYEARLLADRAGVVVLSVDYRLAPEYPYPAALDDCYAALEWAAGKATEYGVDPTRLGVLGESAGGGLAAGLTLLARDRGGPALTAQFLDAPAVDDRLATPSIRDLPEAPAGKAVNSLLSWQYYLSDESVSMVDIYAAPARAGVGELVGLPPAVLTAYQVDPTRDEGLDYARRLIQAGVPTEIHHYSGAFHVAHAIPGTAIGARILGDRVDALRRLLGVPHPAAR
jgi:acetyl esterase/lipase